MDATTIQVEKSTVRILEKVKRKYGAKSYDKAIRKMASKEVRIPKSMFGADPKLKSFEREEDDFRDL